MNFPRFMAGLAQNLADEGNFATYMMLLMAACLPDGIVSCEVRTDTKAHQ